LASRASCSRLALLEIAVPSSAVNSTSRSSMPSGSGDGSILSADMTPQTSPSTMIGAPAHEQIPVSRAASAIVPGSLEKSSIRAGRPVSRTRVETVGPSSAQRVPTSNSVGRSLQAPSTVAVRSASYRHTATIGSPMIWPTSRAIAANTSADAAPPATRVATRRSDSCSARRLSVTKRPPRARREGRARAGPAS
jgi:hypothetical protein